MLSSTPFNLITINERDTLILVSLFDSLKFKELITLKNYINIDMDTLEIIKQRYPNLSL